MAILALFLGGLGLKFYLLWGFRYARRESIISPNFWNYTSTSIPYPRVFRRVEGLGFRI